MRRTASVLLAGALALGAVATTEGEDLSEHPCYDEATGELSYTEQAVWFHEGDSKIGNTSTATHPFDTNEPTASVTAGAGAGQYGGAAASTAGTEVYDNIQTVFAGTFDGCIDTILLDIYSFDPTNRTSVGAASGGNPAQPQAHEAQVTVTIDGLQVAGGQMVFNTTFSNEAAGPNLNRVAFNLGETLANFDGQFGFEAAGEHTIEIGITPHFVNTGHAFYVWDTTEVPSGLTFNGEITEDYVPSE